MPIWQQAFSFDLGELTEKQCKADVVKLVLLEL